MENKILLQYEVKETGSDLGDSVMSKVSFCKMEREKYRLLWNLRSLENEIMCEAEADGRIIIGDKNGEIETVPILTVEIRNFSPDLNNKICVIVSQIQICN